MKPNGRRAWRAAAKKLRRKIGRRWRSQSAEWSGKSWSELVPDLEAHRAHVTGSWFKRHGFTMDDPRYQIRQYIGTWGTVDGDGVEFAIKPASFTPRSLVGMTQGARKRKVWAAYQTGISESWSHLCDAYRIGQKLRPCAGCIRCMCATAFDAWPELGEALAADLPTCDGSGVLPARNKGVACLHRGGSR